MQIIGIATPLLSPGDDLATILLTHGDIRDGDIVVVSSKAVATVEGAAIELATLDISDRAQTLSESYGKDVAYRQAVLNETARMNGEIIQGINGVVLTELLPDGLSEGSILVPNAGLDRSNVAEGYAIGWPHDPVASCTKLRDALGGNVGIILSDSGLSPRRKGVVAFALAVSGLHPFVSQVGQADLFGQELRVTEEAVADQLATAANFVMGNSNQCMPAAIIRGHQLSLCDYAGWVPGIKREEDIYHHVI